MPSIFGKAHIALYLSRAPPTLLPIPLHTRHMMRLQTKKTKKSRIFTVYPCALLLHQIIDVALAAMRLSPVLLTLSVLQAELHAKRLLAVSARLGIETLTEKKFYSMRMKQHMLPLPPHVDIPRWVQTAVLQPVTKNAAMADLDLTMEKAS